MTVGKVDDLFAKRGVTEALHSAGNAEGEELLVELARKKGRGLIFGNLVDFDQQYGHRNDPAGFARALEQFDLSKIHFGEVRTAAAIAASATEA